MYKHFLSPLFAPESIVVFAGQVDDPASQTPHAQALHAALKAQPYTGRLTFLDIHTSGTLADLAQARADLAIIALPPQDVALALEVAGRMACRAALLVSSGVGAEQAAHFKKVARQAGIHLLGPNSLGLQRPQLQLNASGLGALAAAGPLALVSQSGSLTAACWTGRAATRWASRRWCPWGRTRPSTSPMCSTTSRTTPARKASWSMWRASRTPAAS